jgi:hypothetical protein
MSGLYGNSAGYFIQEVLPKEESFGVITFSDGSYEAFDETGRSAFPLEPRDDRREAEFAAAAATRTAALHAAQADYQKQHTYMSFFTMPSQNDNDDDYDIMPAFMNKIRVGIYAWLCFHINVRLPAGGEGLLVDIGAIGNLCGSRWSDRVEQHVKASGQGCQRSALSNPISIEGVGTGASQAAQQFCAPVAFKNGDRASFTAPVVPNSDLPALWGLNSLERVKAIIDTAGRRLILPGPGGYRLQLSPGSRTHVLEKAESGHLLLPCTAWTDASVIPETHETALLGSVAVSSGSSNL